MIKVPFNTPIPPAEGRKRVLRKRATHVLAARIRSLLTAAPDDVKETAIKILLQDWL